MRGDPSKGGSRLVSGRTLERANPGESAGNLSALPARVKAQELRLAPPCGRACSPYQALKEQHVGPRQWRRCRTLREAELRRVKSHGRGDPAIRFTRVKGEETVKRETKP
jgi:hypothetical protein